MMRTFPNYPVSKGSGASTQAQVVKKSLGDGYTQTASAGLNSIRKTYVAIFDVRLNADINAIELFLNEHAGHVAFEYTLPRESVARRWRCEKWAVTRVKPTFSSLTATFIEDFGL